MKCFHHNDADGHAAAYQVHKNVSNSRDDIDFVNDFIEIDYPDVFPLDKIKDNEDIVYIVDIAFSINTIEQLESICHKAKRIVWIDHHASSKQMINQFKARIDALENLEVYVHTQFCATYLTYTYFKTGHAAEENFPLWIKYIDDYDCWKKKMKDTDYFILAIMSKDDDGPRSEIWKNIANGTEDAIKTGKYIKEYLDVRYANDRKDGIYEYKIDGIKTAVINNRGNSWCFGDLMDKYDLVCLWDFCGPENVYKYSIYTSKLDRINCAQIAAIFGGGGHPGAAGFSSKNLLFRPKSEVVKDDLKVFLGGTCNNTTWRDRVIDILNVPYFNPVVKDWTPECKVKEDTEKTKCCVHLYTITPQMTGVYSIAEIVESLYVPNRNTIFCILKENEGKKFDDAQLKSLEAVADIVRKSDNGHVFYSLMEAAIACNYTMQLAGYKKNLARL